MLKTIIGVVLGIIFILFVLHVTSTKEGNGPAKCIQKGWQCGPDAPLKCCPGTYCNDKCGCCA